MSTKAFNKRIHFTALASNAGFDCLLANEWYCTSLSIRDRRNTPNTELLARFTSWAGSNSDLERDERSERHMERM